MMIYIGVKKPFLTFAERASVLCDEGVLIVFIAFSLVLLFCKRLLWRDRQLLGYGMLGIILASILKNFLILLNGAWGQYKENKRKKKEEQAKLAEEAKNRGSKRERRKKVGGENSKKSSQCQSH